MWIISSAFLQQKWPSNNLFFFSSEKLQSFPSHFSSVKSRFQHLSLCERAARLWDRQNKECNNWEYPDIPVYCSRKTHLSKKMERLKTGEKIKHIPTQSQNVIDRMSKKLNTYTTWLCAGLSLVPELCLTEWTVTFMSCAGVTGTRSDFRVWSGLRLSLGRYFQFVKQSRHLSWGSREGGTQTFHLSLCWVPQTKLTICAHVDESYRFYLITTSQTVIIPVCLLVKQIPEQLRKQIKRCLITLKDNLPKTLTINI